MDVLFLFILDSKIGDEGAKQISKSLETNKTLTTLNLLSTFLDIGIKKNLLEEITILLKSNISFQEYLSKMKLSLKLYNLQNGYDLFFK